MVKQWCAIILMTVMTLGAHATPSTAVTELDSEIEILSSELQSQDQSELSNELGLLQESGAISGDTLDYRGGIAAGVDGQFLMEVARGFAAGGGIVLGAPRGVIDESLLNADASKHCAGVNSVTNNGNGAWSLRLNSCHSYKLVSLISAGATSGEIMGLVLSVTPAAPVGVVVGLAAILTKATYLPGLKSCQAKGRGIVLNYKLANIYQGCRAQ